MRKKAWVFGKCLKFSSKITYSTHITDYGALTTQKRAGKMSHLNYSVRRLPRRGDKLVPCRARFSPDSSTTYINVNHERLSIPRF